MLTTQNLNQNDYTLLRFELLSVSEGLRLQPYLDTRRVDPHPTIGIGFDLRDAGSRNRVFDAFGINQNDPVDPDDHQGRTFRQELVSIINQPWNAGQNNQLRMALNNVMTNRAARLTQLNILVTHQTFAFLNSIEARGVFDLLIPVYERRVDSGLINPLPNSRERAVAVSLSYVGDYELATQAAINSGDRAEAWYEIRYVRDNNDYRRHSIEAKIFGLYDLSDSDPVADREQKERNSLHIFRMYNKHEKDINGDDPRIIGALNNANEDLRTIQQRTNQVFGIYKIQNNIENEFEPAKITLVENFATLPPDVQAELQSANFFATNPNTFLLNPGEIDGVFVATAGVAQDRRGNPIPGEVAAHTVDRTGRETANDRIYSGQDDLIFGGIDSGTTSGGDDTLIGASGNDLFIGGLGNDSHDGGDGEDTVSYLRSPSAVTVNLQSNFGDGGYATGDSYQNIEHIIGSPLNDTLTGDDQANTLIGLEGKDTIDGGNGNDIILGNDGQDILYGNSGDDILVGGKDNDILDGGDGNDKAVFSGFLDNYDILSSDNKTFTVKPKQKTILGGEDTLKNIERLQFRDALLSLPGREIEIFLIDTSLLGNGIKETLAQLQTDFNDQVLRAQGLSNKTAASSSALLIGNPSSALLAETSTSSTDSPNNASGLPFFDDLLVQTPAGHFIEDFGKKSLIASPRNLQKN